MASLAGFHQFRTGPPPEGSLLDKMAGALRPRGGQEARYFKKNTGFVARFPKGEAEVFWASNARGNVWGVCFGVWENAREIRGILEKNTGSPVGSGAAALMIRAYEEWGEAFQEKLAGAVSWVLWDEVYGKLLLRRDALGVHSLYYTTREGVLYFSSDLKALLQTQAPAPRLDAKQALVFLSLRHVPSPDTLLQGVRKLSPGGGLSCQKGRMDQRKPLAPPWEKIENMQEIQKTFFPVDVLERFFSGSGSSLEQSGLLLSGGHASSALAVFLAERGYSLKAFTVGFSRWSLKSESNGARRLARQLKWPHREMLIEGRFLAELLPKLAAHWEDPVWDPSLLPYFLACLLARQEVSLAFSGEGARECFAAEVSHRLETSRFFRVWGKGRNWWRLLPFPRNMRRILKVLSDDDPVSRRCFWLALTWEETLRRIAGEVLRYEWEKEPLIALKERWAKDLPQGPPLYQRLVLDLRGWLGDGRVRGADQMSKAAELEVRKPFLQPSLVVFAAQKAYSDPKNFVAAGAIHETFFRGKYAWLRKNREGTSRAPLGNWLRRDLRSLMEERISSLGLAQRGLIDKKNVAMIWREHLKGKEDHADLLFSLLFLEWWCERYIQS